MLLMMMMMMMMMIFLSLARLETRMNVEMINCICA